MPSNRGAYGVPHAQALACLSVPPTFDVGAAMMTPKLSIPGTCTTRGRSQ